MISSKRVDENPLALKSRAMEPVSFVSAQLFPDNTLSSCTNFYTEQLNSERQGGLQFPKNPTHYCTKTLQSRSSCFLKKKFSKSSEYYNIGPGL